MVNCGIEYRYLFSIMSSWTIKTVFTSLNLTNLDIVTHEGTKNNQKFRKMSYKRSITVNGHYLGQKRNTYLADLWQPLSIFTTLCSKKISNVNEIGEKYLNSYEDIGVALRDWTAIKYNIRKLELSNYWKSRSLHC